MIEAGSATDAAEHVLENAAQHLAPSVVEQDDVICLRSVGIAVVAGAGGEGRISGDVLPCGRAGEQAEDGGRVFERRHELLDRGDDDMDARQRRGEIAVAFVGDDH